MIFRATLLASTFLAGGMAAADTAPAGNRVDVNGMQMYYEVSGTGDPLIVLHGAYMNIPAMGEIIPRLAETHTVYALELQGHGRTTDVDRPMTYPALAGDVAAFMDTMGIEKADVFGYSMGAGAGLRLAIDHPEKVDQLVFVSGSYDIQGWQPGMIAFLQSMTVDMFVGTPMEAEYRKLAADPEGFPGLVEKLVGLEREPQAWGAEVDALTLPVLIVAGDADFVTLDHYVDMFGLLGGGVMGDMGQPLSTARLAVLPATSHTAVINQTDLLMGFVGPFLAGETPQGMQ